MKTLLHGGDYNPDQWLDRPDILDEDFRLFPLAGVNTVSIGIFAWTRLEPHDGVYDFGWLDALMDRLAKAGMKALLATPTGAKPAWMSQKYPEILRCGPNRERDLHGARHNHCYTSPVYRRKATEINRKLAERYQKHPALLMWHVSNEYGGECHCPLCQGAFRGWLQKRYGSLDALNKAWWTDFWSHRFTDWSQVESPAPQGETMVHGLNLDWKRFVDHQSLEFFRTESAPLRELTPGTKVLVNMMGTYPGLNYWNWAPHVDVISWDSYPRWHNADHDDVAEGALTAFVHDINRTLKHGQPWLLMESTPSQVNWQPVNRLKRPGLHRLASLQAVAHGSDSVLYFQWRKGRGAFEKFHGAVVDHAGHEHTRTFAEVAQVGSDLKALAHVQGTRVPAQTAVIYDWENRWAIDDFAGYNRPERDYPAAVSSYYRGLWNRSVGIDVPNQDQDLAGYKLVAAPWLYLVKPGTAERLQVFVENGGTLVLTFFSGWVNETDLTHLGGFPGPLRSLAGVWAEELDPLWKAQTNSAIPSPGNDLGLTGTYEVTTFCELVHAEGSEVLATYGSDWYAGRPVLTRHKVGKGEVYYVAAQTDRRFVDDLMAALVKRAGLTPVVEGLPPGVVAEKRTDGTTDTVFTFNFNGHEAAGLPPFGARWDVKN
ncbi:MAG: beta-galactosidase [Spirochaetales bacterium]